MISTYGGKVRLPEMGEMRLDWFEGRIGVVASSSQQTRGHKT